MPKKKPKRAELLESAHSIWLAGLGGLALAEEEGGRLFRRLVDRGRKMEDRLTNPLGDAGRSLRNRAGDAGKAATRGLKSIGAAVDDGLTSALGRVGVPSRAEIARLAERVEALAAHLEALRKAGAAEAKRAKTKTGASASRKRASGAKAESGGRRTTATAKKKKTKRAPR